MSDQAISLGRYVKIASGTKIVTLLVSFSSSIAGINLDLPSPAFSIIVAGVAAHIFVKDHRREPTPEERKKLSLYTFCIIFGIEIIMVGMGLLLWGTHDELAFIKQRATDLRYLFIAGTVLIAIFCFWFGVFYYLSYGWYARFILRSFDKKQSAL